ncbi:uncharacterized protein [Nyctibius grandis]|uniref:uncharacterized protein isoform X2 n=1 Tax=Nyctibius grandis TaxID=48427 RepID=UPI0035BC0D47
MPRGQTWTQAEVRRLLALVGGSEEVAQLMASTSRPNEALWQEISRGLSAAGYRRSVAQCRSKWKALKQAFHSERERRRKAGCHSPFLPPHYRAMKDIWKAAGRPVFRERRMPDLVKQPPRRHRSALTAHSPSSPELPEHSIDGDTPGMLLSPQPQRVKDEPESSVGDHVTGVLRAPPTMPHGDHCFPPLPLLVCHTALKEERAEQKAGKCLWFRASSPAPGSSSVLSCPWGRRAGAPAGSALPGMGLGWLQHLPCQTIVADFPGQTSLGMGTGNRVLPVATTAPGSPGTAAMSEQLAADKEASDASLHGSGVAGLLQSIQQLLVQILQTSRQQQALLESLASDTVSHLHLLSHSLVQVGETLHQLLLRPQTLSSPLGHYVFQGSPGVPCSPSTLHSSPDHKEESQVSPAASCTPP